MKRTLPAVAVTVALVSPAWADYFAFGAGTNTCGEVTDYHDKYGRLDLLEHWIFGYVTGRNFENDSMRGKDSQKAFYAAIIKYCRDNPLKDVVYAADDVYDQLR